MFLVIVGMIMIGIGVGGVALVIKGFKSLFGNKD